MFKSYRKLKATTVGSICLASMLALTSCGATEPTDSVKKAADTLVEKAKSVKETSADVVKDVAKEVTKKVEKVAEKAPAKESASAAAVVATVSEKMGGSGTYANGKFVIDGGVTYPSKENKSGPYAVNPQVAKDVKSIKYGRTATKAEIAAWDIDVMPDGTGLPKGHGTVEEGDEIYEAQCVSCHGDFGSGGGGYPALSKGNAAEGHASLKLQRASPDDDGPVRVFGSYWPYASTLWWYIKTGMPHPAPLSLSDDDVYALCAYILAINEIEIDGEELDDEYDLDKAKFLKIVMPNKDGFVPNIDGKNGVEDVRAFYHNTANYGNGTRCMKDCFEGKPKVQDILIPMTDFHPPLSKAKDLPKDTGAKEVPGQKTYEASCAVCHATDTMGAPMLGDKAVWAKVMKQGMDTVLKNSINGKNGMPPKGGTSLADDKMKEVVEYMINKSK
jgi:cytochrome c